MAHELYNRGILRAVVETTPNPSTPEVVANTDVHYCPPESTFVASNPTVIQREGISAFRSGHRPVGGGFEPSWSHVSEVDFVTIADGTTRPVCHPWLVACGFVPAYAANVDYVGPDVVASGGDNDKILTYTPKTFDASTESSIRINYTHLQGDRTEGLLEDIRGARCDWELSLEMGMRWGLVCKDGKGIGTDRPTKVSSPSTQDSYSDKTIAVVLGQQYALVALAVASDVVYGGGTEASPTRAAHLRKFSLSGNAPVVVDKGPGGTGGVLRARHNVGPAMTGALTIEMVTWPDDWDLYEFIKQGTVMRLALNQPSPTSGDYIALTLHFVIASATPTVLDGLTVVDLAIASAFPESSSDDGGLRPDEPFKLQWITQA